jgi:hypothetical protein
MSLLLTCALALTPLAFQDPIEVRIRRIGGGSVAGAQVRWWNASRKWFEWRTPVDLQSIDEVARRAENAVGVDETGRVWLPFGSRRCVVASLPGWWGMSLWDEYEAEPDLTLYPDHDLTVLVTGADGKPLGGVPVHLLQERSTEGLVEVGDDSLRCGAVRSGADDGIARLAHVGFIRSRLADGRPLHVRIDAFPESSGARARVPDEIDDTPLVLSAANLTQVSIEAVDKDGRPVGQAFEAALVHDPNAASNPSPSSSVVARAQWAIEPSVPGGKPHIRASTLESETSFECVDVAAGLVALVRRNTLSDWSGRLVDRHAVGGAQRVPLQLGEGCESVVLSLKLGEDPITAGTVRVRRGVSPQDLAGPVMGAPRAGGTLRSFWESGLLAWTDGYWTDWVELPLSELRVDFAPAARAATGLLGITTHTPDGKRRFALVDVRARTPRVEHRVEIDLTNCDQAITGAIEDGSGRPVPDAVVHLELPLQPEGSLHDPTYGPCIRLWSEVTDGYGRFQLPCPQKGPFRVLATSADQFVEVFRDGVLAGANVSLELSPRGGVRGVLRTTGPLGSTDLNVLLLRYAFAGDKQPSSGFTLGCSCEGEFEFKNARAGRYTLIVRRAQGRAPPIELLRVEEVEVTAGEVTDLGELRVE